LHRMFLLNAGIRYDHYTTFGGEANPRFALVCQPLTNTAIKLIYGSAFRAPNVYELYYDDQRTQKGNHNLEPEKINTYELILEQRLGKKMKAIISGYHYNIEQLIDQQIDPADGMIVFNNVASATANGMELALLGKAINDIDWKASYTLNETKDDDTNTRLSNSPRHMIKGNIAVPLFSPKLIGGLEAQYMSRRTTLSGNDTDGFTILNATLLSRDLWGFEVALSVYNLLDEEYGDPGSVEHVQDIIIQDGRTFRIKATYTF
jgi:outer membrane receptor for ferrienterochelin and colicins